MADGTVAETIAAHLAGIGGAVPVMSGAGPGWAEPLLGSVVEDLLHETFGPVILVGPQCRFDRADFGGELVVPVDRSVFSEKALGLAGDFGTRLGARPWVTTVLPPTPSRFGDVLESSYPKGLAAWLAVQTQRDTEFEVLHDHHPDRAIVDFARSIDASLIVASTHGRNGLARIALGSVAMGIVHRASCPVVVQRPPALKRRPRTIRQLANAVPAMG